MADTHDYFLQFEQNITIPRRKIEKLRSSRKALQKRIVDYFKFKPGVSVPKFFIQGSYKMRTMIVAKDGTYDVDLGVYFLEKPNVEPATLQKWIIEAVRDHTVAGAEHREKCVRVIFQGEFDIDLPVYYMTPTDKHPHLATKTQKWLKSDPKELCDWFQTKRDPDGQLLRIAKYFKAWANARSKKMPSGIAFAVWAAKYYKSDARDDISFLLTAKAIKWSFFLGMDCKNPATPGDDFLEKLTDDQKDNFKQAFKELISCGDEALNEKDELKAARIWKRQLGFCFPV